MSVKLCLPIVARALCAWVLTLSCAAAQSTGAKAGPIQGRVDFVKQIAPIFKARCFECHSGDEDEGDLRLDLRAVVFAPSRSPAAIVPGKPAESEIFVRISLPADDDDIMPADGDPLTSEQIALIKRWIEEGARWPDGSVQPAPRKPEREALRVPELDARALDAEAKALERLAKDAVPAARVAKTSNALYVNLSLLGAKCGDAQVDLLAGLEPSLVWLHLGRTAVTDTGVAKLARFRQLRRLHLEQTRVTDVGLAALAKLEQLTYLNLYATQVTDAGLARLVGLTKLRRLYLWRTKVTDAGVQALQNKIPGLTIDRGGYVDDIAKLAAAIEAQRPVNDTCPVLGKKVNDRQVVDYKGERIAFCCAKCVAKFKKHPATFLAKLVRVRGPKAKRQRGKTK